MNRLKWLLVVAVGVYVWLLQKAGVLMVDYSGLLPEAQQMKADIEAFCRANGIPWEWTSGYRSPERQAFLRAEYDAGRGSLYGLIVRPAKSSAHTEGKALDGKTPNSADQERVGRYAVSRGYRWGGNKNFNPFNFNPVDPVHFDTRNKVA